jgi:hypothetical protein
MTQRQERTSSPGKRARRGSFVREIGSTRAGENLRFPLILNRDPSDRSFRLPEPVNNSAVSTSVVRSRPSDVGPSSLPREKWSTSAWTTSSLSCLLLSPVSSPRSSAITSKRPSPQHGRATTPAPKPEREPPTRPWSPLIDRKRSRSCKPSANSRSTLNARRNSWQRTESTTSTASSWRQGRRRRRPP